MKSFNPAIGVLCVNVLVSDAGTTLSYVFRDKPDDLNHFIMICYMSEFTVRPCRSGYHFTNLDVARIDGVTSTPVVEHRHECTWEELCAIKSFWQKPPQEGQPDASYVSFGQWLTETLKNKSNPEAVKDHLRRLVHRPQ